ncbi:hypothetical protein P5W99_24570 [Paraburkholderia sp. A3BS-1L]|uniref:hypothetical protein n=1 Tax=Paraburkholderia sp. A3BS-1L TaxID=3028375 RepID=UPI003DA7EFFF
MFICLVVLLVSIAGFSAGFIAGSAWAAIGMMDKRQREIAESVGADVAPYPRAWD